MLWGQRGCQQKQAELLAGWQLSTTAGCKSQESRGCGYFAGDCGGAHQNRETASSPLSSPHSRLVKLNIAPGAKGKIQVLSLCLWSRHRRVEIWTMRGNKLKLTHYIFSISQY